MPSDTPTRRDWRVIYAVLAGVTLCWMLLTPPGAGPDEQNHLTRAGMIAHGDFSGVIFGEVRSRPAALPTRYLTPPPYCYIFEPLVSVECAATETQGTLTADGRVTLGSSASGYPIWAHLVSSPATRLPGIAPIWSARASSAAVVVGLLTAAMVSALRRDRLVASGVLVALTPVAWLTFPTVNPSAIAIAGGVALWTSLAGGLWRDQHRAQRWLFAAGWAALVLTRRDGLMWSCLSLVIVICADGRPALAQLRGPGRRPDLPALVVGATTVLMVVWAATHPSRTVQLGATAPLSVAAAWLARWSWDRLAGRRLARAWLAAACGVLGVGVVAVLSVARPGGWDAPLAGQVISATGDNLIQTIGLLGWLDTMPPMSVMIGWPAIVGVLVTASLVAGWRTPLLAAATLGTAIVTSWVFELQNGTTFGRYWQGRYWMPLVVGVPIVLAARHGLSSRHATRLRPGATDLLARVVGLSALGGLNVMAWAAARRWGVGIDGSHLPWRWGTSLQPVAPVIVLGAHLIATAALALVLFVSPTGHREDTSRTNDPA